MLDNNIGVPGGQILAIEARDICRRDSSYPLNITAFSRMHLRCCGAAADSRDSLPSFRARGPIQIQMLFARARAKI